MLVGKFADGYGMDKPKDIVFPPYHDRALEKPCWTLGVASDRRSKQLALGEGPSPSGRVYGLILRARGWEFRNAGGIQKLQIHGLSRESARGAPCGGGGWRSCRCIRSIGHSTSPAAGVTFCTTTHVPFLSVCPSASASRYRVFIRSPPSRSTFSAVMEPVGPSVS